MGAGRRGRRPRLAISVTDRPGPPQAMATERTVIGTRDEFWAQLAPQVGWLHTQLRRFGVAERDLADVSQETLVAVHARWSEYDSARPLRPWLLAFAARMASNYRRRADVRRERIGLMDSLDDTRATDLAALDDPASKAQARALVVEALQALDDDRRVIFVAVEIEGMTVPEITASLGIPLNTGYTRLRLGRADFAAAVLRLERGGRR